MKIKAVATFIGALMFCVHSLIGATLGQFTFNDSQFGDTLSDSDGGTFRNRNWLNVVNVNPGSPAVLTGPNFDTGLANIGLGAMPLYTIGYNTPIANGPGADLGIVSARFSTNDTFSLALSTDGINFTPPIAFGPGLAVSANVGKAYFFGPSGGPFGAVLYVTPVDLSAFGLASGATISAARITASPEGDLIRVAGFAPVPEPGALLFVSCGAFWLIVRAQRRHVLR